MPEAKTLESKWEMDDSFKVQNGDIWASDQVQQSCLRHTNFQSANLQNDILMRLHPQGC